MAVDKDGALWALPVVVWWLRVFDAGGATGGGMIARGAFKLTVAVRVLRWHRLGRGKRRATYAATATGASAGDFARTFAGASTGAGARTGARTGAGASAGAGSWASSGTSTTAARCTGAIATAASSGAVRSVTITRATGLITPARAGAGAATIAATGAAGTGVSPWAFALCFTFPRDANVRLDHDRAAPVAHVCRGIAVEAVPSASRTLFALLWATCTVNPLHLRIRARRFFYTDPIDTNLALTTLVRDARAALLVLARGAWVFRFALTVTLHKIRGITHASCISAATGLSRVGRTNFALG